MSKILSQNYRSLLPALVQASSWAQPGANTAKCWKRMWMMSKPLVELDSHLNIMMMMMSDRDSC
jgi:hypothetical protein